MRLGTVESVQTETAIKRRRASITTSGGGPGGRSGRNGGGGDGRDPRNDRGDRLYDTAPIDKTRIITAFLLLAVLMTFGGLIAAYIVISTNGPAEWKPFSLPGQVWVSTALIVLASISYHYGKLAIDKNDALRARKWLIVTTALGAAFISSQIVLWLELIKRGYYMSGNPYAGFFYILTAVHAVHVTGGVAALGSVLLRGWYPTVEIDEEIYRRNLARAVGWYWHFMGVLWITIFLLLEFWQ